MRKMIFLAFFYSGYIQAQSDDMHVFPSSNPQSENSLAINPADPNNVIIVANGRSVLTPTRKTEICWFYTINGGTSWTGSENTPGETISRGDPVVFFDVNGNAFFSAL